MHSTTYDWTKHLALGLGIGIGTSIVFFKYYKAQANQGNELTELVGTLVAEVRQLKETIARAETATLGHVAARKERNEEKKEINALSEEEDDEFFDSSQSPDIVCEIGDSFRGEESDDVSEKLKELERVRENGSDDNKQESYNILLKLSEKFASDCEVLWRFARAQYDMAMLSGKRGDQNQKINYMKQGMVTGERSVELDDNNAAAHKWYGILIGNYCEFCGNQEKIQLGYEYKKHIEKAMQLNPTDPSACSLLARWCYEVAMLPWYMRKVAAAVFADPPSSTIEEALEYAIKAEELRPNFWKENSLLIGKCYYQKSDYGNARKWLQQAKELPTISEDDRLAQKEIEELLLKI